MSSNNGEEKRSLAEMRSELIADTVSSRMKLIILAETPEKRRFPTLELLTGVSENTWRTWWRRGGTPSGTMVEGIARAWPHYAFWLASGLTDIEYGHRMPQLHVSVIGYVSNWPEGQLKQDRVYGEEYFKICKDMQDLHKKLNGQTGQQGEILENSREFVRQKRWEEVSKGVNFNKWSGQEE